MTAFSNRLDKTMLKFSAYIPFDKATNGQTNIKHEMGKTLSSMSLLTIVDEKLHRRRERELFTYNLQQWHWLTELNVFPISCFISVCRFVEGNACRKSAHCFCVVNIKKRSFLTSSVFRFVFLNASSSTVAVMSVFHFLVSKQICFSLSHWITQQAG